MRGHFTPSPAAAVEEFHERFGLPARPEPTIVSQEECDLRVRLLEEEYREYLQAAGERDLVAIADALGDMVYVIYGTALTYGIDLDKVIAEIHASNMTKLGPDGEPVRRADGKILKGPNYRAPNLAAVLEVLSYQVRLDQTNEAARRLEEACADAVASTVRGRV